MLTVTAQAATELKTIAQAEATDPGEALRLIPTGEGKLALVVDAPREGDQVVEHEGINILLIGLELNDAVDGLVLDCKDTPQGLQLTISGPDAES